MPDFVLLWTDAAIWLLLLAVLGYIWRVRRSPSLRATWRRVFQNPAAMGASIVLVVSFAVAVLDSVHYRPLLPPPPGSTFEGPIYDARTHSLLDAVLAPLIAGRETSYSAPRAYQGFSKETIERGGQIVNDYPRLTHGGAALTSPQTQWIADLLRRGLVGAAGGAGAAVLAFVLLAAVLARSQRRRFGNVAAALWRGEGALPWHAAGIVFATLAVVAGTVTAWAQAYHVLGTDRIGNDVLYQSLKSLRTAYVIGSLSTIATLPLAVGLGIAAGYLKGWVDEAIQYVYTMLSSIPNVLLIAACVLMMQVFFDKHAAMFETEAERSDLRLFMLCAILGLTGWAGLCRLLRGETMKLRELEYVQAAQAFGVSHWRIMQRHVFPNVIHLVLITTVLDFCALILYEAVLSYVGVGVDPSMNSFGGMINLARSEMSRNPVVWWSFASAFVFMVTLVLAANLFADGVQDAFDPRSRAFRPRRLVKPKAV